MPQIKNFCNTFDGRDTAFGFVEYGLRFQRQRQWERIPTTIRLAFESIVAKDGKNEEIERFTRGWVSTQVHDQREILQILRADNDKLVGLSYPGSNELARMKETQPTAKIAHVNSLIECRQVLPNYFNERMNASLSYQAYLRVSKSLRDAIVQCKPNLRFT